MKILHLIYDHIKNPWVGGGAAIRAHEIYRRLADRHEITVVCGRYPGAENYREGALVYEFVGTSRDNYVLSTFSYAFRARGFLAAHHTEFDVIVEDFAPYNPLFSFLQRPDTVIQVHQKEGMQHLKKYFLLGLPFMLAELYYPKLFEHAITVSDESLRKFHLGPSAAVISNGFDPQLLTEDAHEADYVLFLGRLDVHQKGLDILAQALKNIECRLVLAGGGKDEKKVGKLFERLISEKAVTIAGFVGGRHKIELLRGCKFMVVPSRYEAQAIVVLEAAACEKPVIVSDIPELRYAVDAGFALSFRTGDAKDLAEKLNMLLQGPSLRQEMGIRAREYAKEFTWDRIAGEYEKFLMEIGKKT